MPSNIVSLLLINLEIVNQLLQILQVFSNCLMRRWLTLLLL